MAVSEPLTVAALYVEPGGVYYDMPGVDPWDEERDARTYPGPWPVVAHPPCARWCRLARFVESQHPHLRVGDDGGCFSAALDAVRRYGGVLEHPAWSLAWKAHGLAAPVSRYGWSRTIDGFWVTEVAQRNYGHPCTKWTWLLYHGRDPQPFRWATPPPPTGAISSCTRRADGTVCRGKRVNGLQKVNKKLASRTPSDFRNALLDLARSAQR